MAEILTWRDFSDFKQTVRLGDRLFVIRARWNTSRAYWTLDIFDALGRAILFGQKIVLNTDILDRYNDPALPDGRLFAIDVENLKQVSPDGEVMARIGRNDIGQKVFIVYEANA